MDSVIVAVVLLGVCQCIAVFCGCLFLRQVLNAKQAEIEKKMSDAVHGFIDPGGPEGNEPSQLGKILQAAGVVMGSAAAKSLIDQYAAMTTHMKKAETSALTEIGAAGGISPLELLAKGKGKGGGFAMLAQALLPMLGNMLQGQRGGGNGGSSSLRDRLRRGG